MTEEEVGASGDPQRRNNRRDLLRGYYGTAEDMKQQDLYDINEAYFQHEKYLDKMFKEKSLHELMDKESEIIKRKCLLQIYIFPYFISPYPDF